MRHLPSFCLLLAGLCCFFAFLFIPGNPKYLGISSGILIAGAYFLTLLEDYRKRCQFLLWDSGSTTRSGQVYTNRSMYFLLS